MTHHTTIFTGDGYRCDRCRVAWDTGEDAPEECVIERDPNTGDQSVVKALSVATRDQKLGGGYATGGVVTLKASDAPAFFNSDFVVSKEQAIKLASRYLAADLAARKDPAIKQGFTDLAEQLRNPKPEPMAVQVGGRHYADMAIQPTEFCMKNGWDFCLGAILKYLSRYRVKNGIEDLKKARHFVLIRQGYATHAEPPRCRLITMNTYIFENSIKREDSYALILLDEYAGSAGHHMNVNADRLVVEIDKLIAAQERLSAHRQHFSG